MVSSRSLDDLDPRVKDLCEKFLEATSAAGFDVLITSTYRDNDAQQALWQQGRGTPGMIVTNAKPGESFHNYKLAFDFVPLVNGKCSWGDSSVFTQCGTIGKDLGLEWAGDWTGKLREMAHCQWTGGLSIKDLQNGKRP
jgi:peptidoglycan LD-endopeptidase CwlK